MLPVKFRISRNPSLLNDDSADVLDGMLVLAATVLALEAKSRLWGRIVLDVVNLTRAAVEVVGKGKKAGGRGVPPPAK